MFVPVDLLKPILDEMQATGSSKQSRRPWLGLTSTEQSGHVQVVRVSKDSPAQDGGIMPGDVILAVDDTQVATLEQLYKRLWAHPNPDDEIKLTVQQGRHEDGDGEGRRPHEHDAQARRDLTASPCSTVG